MKTSNTILCLSSALLIMMSRVSFAQQKVAWNGYLQTRFSDDFLSTTGFSIRRAKMWIAGPTPVDSNLSFRMQGIFRYQTSGTFMLQDVYAQYRLPFGFVRGGQFVPDFSLERSQSDAYLPIIERAAVDNTLIPTASTYARDIGAEFVFQPAATGLHTSFGIYNGNGGNTKSNEDRQFLYTNRTTYEVRVTERLSWTSGFSASYRDKSNLAFPGILGNGKTFSGKDFRWGLETHLQSAKWEIQGEYIQADLGNVKSYGYYVLGDYMCDSKNEITASTEALNVPIPTSSTTPWYIIGYSHLFAGQKEKLIVDVRTQRANNRSNYEATAQFQIFFN